MSALVSYSTDIDFQNEGDIQVKPLLCEDVYDMEEIIGEGTFSSVVRARNLKTSVMRAIKIIDMEKMDTSKRRARVQNEIELHKRSAHPHVVQLYESYETDADACLVMELCQGGELFERIVRRGFYSEPEAARVVRQIASAVSAMHSRGIVHRDIKPENLLYVSQHDDSDIKLADFGLAKAIGSPDVAALSGRAELTGSASGTPAYCAPERLSKSREGKSVDMWSVGCIVYFLLYGVPPFYSDKEDADDADDEIIDNVMHGHVQFPENRPISDLAKDVILRLLNPDPDRRLTADGLLQHPWLSAASLGGPCCEQLLSTSGRLDGKPRTMLRSTINKVIDHETRW